MPDCMPGIRIEKLTASIVISRFIRRATSVNRSIWKPSMPPPSLGMACGAKVPSTPVRRGGSFSWASAGAAQKSAAAATKARRRRIILSLLGTRGLRAWARPGCRGAVVDEDVRESMVKLAPILPHERNEPVPHPPLVFRVAPQIFCEEALLVEEPPDEEREGCGERDESPVRTERQR